MTGPAPDVVEVAATAEQLAGATTRARNSDRTLLSCMGYQGIGLTGQRSNVVYLIHFERPIAHARHYIGYTKGDDEDAVFARLAKHRKGTGARLLQVATERRIRFGVVRTWDGGRDLERQLKRRKEGPRLCPVCTPGLLCEDYE